MLKEADPEFANTYNKLYTKSKGFASRGKADFTINPSKVVRIETQGYTTYTLVVYKEDSPAGSFDNLLIEINKTTGKNNVYLVHYTPDEDGIVHSEAHESFHFNGNTSVTQIDYDASGLLAHRVDCRFITVSYCNWGGLEHVAVIVPSERSIQECDWIPGEDDETETGGTGVPGSEDPDGPGDPGYGGPGGPGGGGSTTPVLPWDEEDIAIMENVISKLSLNFREKQWVREYKNRESVVNIFNFLQLYTSNEAKAFAEEGIETLREDGEVDWEEQIIKDKSFKGTKAECVYQRLMKKTITNLGIIQQTYINFNENLNYNDYYLTYKLNSDMVDSKKGKTVFITNNIYEIHLNENKIEGRAPIEIARTILHESVHALLLKHQYGDGSNSFEEIFKKYIQETTNNSDLHHSIMRDKYVIPIANALKQFDDNSESDFSFYESLAWAGLQENLRDPKITDILEATRKARDKGLNCIE